MNSSCPSAPIHAAAPVAHPGRGLFASLEKLINTASFVSVDLTDTVFVSLHEERERQRTAAGTPAPR
jgi:hypothetical protein